MAKIIFFTFFSYFFIMLLLPFLESEGKMCWFALTLSRTVIFTSPGETNESALKRKKIAKA